MDKEIGLELSELAGALALVEQRIEAAGGGGVETLATVQLVRRRLTALGDELIAEKHAPSLVAV